MYKSVKKKLEAGNNIAGESITYNYEEQFFDQLKYSLYILIDCIL